MGKEKEPKQQFFNLTINQESYVCTPENTEAYLYEDSKYDHIFHAIQDNEEGRFGFYLFRKHLSGFDALVKRMINNGYEVVSENEPSENDLQNYFKNHPEDIPELETHELTPREEKHYRFLEFLIENDLLTDEDFIGDGELYI